MQPCPLRLYYLVGDNRNIYRYSQAGTFMCLPTVNLSFLAVTEFPKLVHGYPSLCFLACPQYGHVTKFCPVNRSEMSNFWVTALKGSYLLTFPGSPFPWPRLHMWECKPNSTITRTTEQRLVEQQHGRSWAPDEHGRQSHLPWLLISWGGRERNRERLWERILLFSLSHCYLVSLKAAESIS